MTELAIETDGVISEFIEAGRTYRDLQAKMIAAREAKDAAIAVWRDAERELEAASYEFRRISESAAAELSREQDQ